MRNRTRSTAPDQLTAYGIAAKTLTPQCSGPDDFVRREDAERFIEEVRGDDPDLASHLRIEERGLEVGGRNKGRALQPTN